MLLPFVFQAGRFRNTVARSFINNQTNTKALVLKKDSLDGWTSRPNFEKKIEQVSEYKNNTAPKAAKFGVGASNLAEIKEATDARRQNSAGLSWGKWSEPRPTANRDAKWT